MKHKILLGWLLVLFSTSLFSFSVNIRFFDHNGFTRVVFEGESNFNYQVGSSLLTLQVDIDRPVDVREKVQDFRGSNLLDSIEHIQGARTSSFRIHFKSYCRVKQQFVLNDPFRLVFDLEKNVDVKQPASPSPTLPPTSLSTPTPVPPSASKSTPTTNPGANRGSNSSSSSDQANITTSSPASTRVAHSSQSQGKSLDSSGDHGQEENTGQETTGRQSGGGITAPKNKLIDTVCIDPGHGGSDLGAIGQSKILEKDITLRIANKLKRIIETKLGLRVVMTRTEDAEVSLDSRAAAANNQEADMFISIHVNGSYRRAANGPETYYVSLKATDQEAFQLAEEENKSFDEIEKMAEEDDQLKMILWNMAQTEYIKESSKLAEFIQNEMNILLHTRNRGVKQAPFRVLMRAAMPAILIEVAFLSNPVEEKKLSTDSFLDEAAFSIYNGISKYIYYKNTTYND